jgi:hypothetical protein
MRGEKGSLKVKVKLSYFLPFTVHTSQKRKGKTWRDLFSRVHRHTNGKNDDECMSIFSCECIFPDNK